MSQRPLDRILQAKMDRKQFLARTGAMLLVVTGAAGIIKSLTPTEPKALSGYGASAYGGRSRAQAEQVSSTKTRVL